MPHTNPEESKRGAGVPRFRARAARTAAPLSAESAGTHTALGGDPSPKSTTTATDVDEATANAHGVAPAGAAGTATTTVIAAHTMAHDMAHDMAHEATSATPTRLTIWP